MLKGEIIFTNRRELQMHTNISEDVLSKLGIEASKDKVISLT
jgi:cobalamin biosynthesis protein CbiG